jgi:hypothetical protein
MEKTLQEQYNLIKEGKGNKAYFLKSAYRLFPDVLSQVNSFEDTTRILKNKGIISEGMIGGVVTTGKKQDWHAIFNENMDKLKEEERTQAGLGLYLLFDKKTGKLESFMDTHDHKEDDNLKKQIENKGQYVLHFVKGSDYNKFKDHFNEFKGKTKQELDISTIKEFKYLKEAKEVKAEEKETTKEVTDMATRGYDYKDKKNYDNVFGEQFLKGYYTEMKDPKNADKDVEELKEIVAKNLSKDVNYYVKNGQFGVKGLGYTTEAPGLGTPKEAKGKYKSSGYGDLKESVLRSQIHLLIKEALKEVQRDPKAYADEEEFETRITAKLKNNDEAKKYFEKHSAEITKKYFNHNKPEGGVSDAVKYILSKAESNPIHEKKKPSAGLTQKEKSAVSKKAHAGKDIGKKGKGFEKVAKAAEKEYGSEEAGKKVAAAAMWKNLAKGKK